MFVKKLRRGLGVVFGSAALALLPTALGYAQQSSSSSYKTNEYFFGNGGEADSTSASYRARGSAGGVGVGNTASTNYFSQTGFVTPQEEFLEMVVNAATIDLGTLNTITAATGTATFYVRAYTSSGYSVQTVSPTPTNGTKALNAMTSTAASSPGTEQFGINLVANTSPTTFGTDPLPQPNSGYAYGTAASDYGTTNNFRYNQGDTIATSPKGIGQTNFTICYIANMAPLSPGGFYTIDHVLVVVATF